MKQQSIIHVLLLAIVIGILFVSGIVSACDSTEQGVSHARWEGHLLHSCWNPFNSQETPRACSTCPCLNTYVVEAGLISCSIPPHSNVNRLVEAYGGVNPVCGGTSKMISFSNHMPNSGLVTNRYGFPFEPIESFGFALGTPNASLSKDYMVMLGTYQRYLKFRLGNIKMQDNSILLDEAEKERPPNSHLYLQFSYRGTVGNNEKVTHMEIFAGLNKIQTFLEVNRKERAATYFLKAGIASSVALQAEVQPEMIASPGPLYQTTVTPGISLADLQSQAANFFIDVTAYFITLDCTLGQYESHSSWFPICAGVPTLEVEIPDLDAIGAESKQFGRLRRSVPANASSNMLLQYTKNSLSNRPNSKYLPWVANYIKRLGDHLNGPKIRMTIRK